MPRIALTAEELKLRPPGTKSKAAPRAGILGGRPKAPKHLCPAALVEFRRVSKLLGARKTETPADSATISIYAEVYSRWVESKAALAHDGIMISVTVLDSTGMPHTHEKLNPLIRVVENCEVRLLALCRAMGITPDTREKIKPAKHKPAPRKLTFEEQYFANADRTRGVISMPGPQEEQE